MKAYQLKIQIKDSHPPIWRRVIVPSGLSFAQLSIILNTVMGWCGYHLSSFEFYHLGIRIEDKDDDFDDMGFGEYVTYDAGETMIDPYLDSEEWFSYVYDFGDWWDHRVTIEKIIGDYDKNYAQVIKFKGQTPYEDCGGIYGYYDLLETLENPDDPEYETMKEWTDGHFTMEYDMDDVNDELEHGLYLTNRKSKPVSQRELYRRYLEEGKPFNRIQGVWEMKELEEFDPFDALTPFDPLDENAVQDALQDLLSGFGDDFIRFLETEHSRTFTHEEILRNYNKENLIEIAKVNNLKGYTRFKKEELVNFLCEALTKKEVMERYFKYADQKALKLFDKEELSFPIETGDDTYDELLDGGYLGYREFLYEGTIVIPETVKNAYKRHFSGNWYEKAADDRRLLCYLNALTRLYGVCPLEKFIELYRMYLDISLKKSEIVAACKEIPENKKAFVIKGDKLVNKKVNQANVIENLEAGQKGKSYYLPTMKEIESLGKQGYLPFDKHMKALEKYLTPLMDDEKDFVRQVCAEIQYIIRIGGRMQDVVDFLDDILLDYEDDWDDEIWEDEDWDPDAPNEAIMNEAFIKLIQDVWNHTRMVANRGHHPNEMYQEQMSKAGMTDNVIPFPGNNRLH